MRGFKSQRQGCIIHKNWSFLLRISSVNVRKSSKKFGDVHIFLKKILGIHRRLIFGNTIRCSRSSHQRSSVKEDVLRNFAKFTGKHLCQRIFFNKVAGLRLDKYVLIMNALISIGISGISRFIKFVFRSVSEEFQLT